MSSPAVETKAVTYRTDTGAEVKLSPGIIRQYLVNGQGNVTDQEVMYFLMTCRNQRLDPFLREAYLIKYGSSAATIVVGKDTFTKRAERCPDYRGFKAGIIVQKQDGELKKVTGGLRLEGETIVGGWAEVYKANRDVPYEVTVSFDEYAGRKQNGELNSQWASKPATMIRKVALVQALREAFPEDFTGLYDQSEMTNVSDVKLDDTPVASPERNVTPNTDPTVDRTKVLASLLRATDAAQDEGLFTADEAAARVAAAEHYETGEKLQTWLEHVEGDIAARREQAAYVDKEPVVDEAVGTEPALPEGDGFNDEKNLEIF